jgi:hypothetical protein
MILRPLPWGERTKVRGPGAQNGSLARFSGPQESVSAPSTLHKGGS